MEKDLSRSHACAFLRLLCVLWRSAALRGIQPLERWHALWARLWMMLALAGLHVSCSLSGGYGVAAALRGELVEADLVIHL